MAKSTILLVALFAALSFGSASAQTEITSKNVSPVIIQKILDAGVPAGSLKRILRAMDGEMGSEMTFKAYWCDNNKNPNGENGRTACLASDDDYHAINRTLPIGFHTNAISIDFSRPSTEKRLYFMNLKTGNVDRFYVTHGVGSSSKMSDGEEDYPGTGNTADRFSNEEGSKMTSLGLYLVKGSYQGGHGYTLRMYGMEDSNDEAYIRNIVFHGADYARESFINRETLFNRKTGRKGPFGRLGHSHGCPAIAPEDVPDIFPKMIDGGIMDHYHPAYTR